MKPEPNTFPSTPKSLTVWLAAVGCFAAGATLTAALTWLLDLLIAMRFNNISATIVLVVLAVALLLAGSSAVMRLDRLWRRRILAYRATFTYFRTVFERHPQAGLLVSAAGVIEAANQGAVELLGYSHTLLTRSRVLDFAAPKGKAAFSLQLAEALDGNNQAFEIAMRLGDGNERNVRVNARAVAPAGVPAGVQLSLAVCDPPTDCGPTAAGGPNERYQQLFQSTPDAIMMLDRQGGIRAVNPALCTLLGKPGEHLQTLNWRDVVDPNDARLPAMLESLSKTDRFCGELSLCRDQGPAVPVEVSAADFADADGGTCSGLILRDLSLRKEATTEVRLLRTCISYLSDMVMIIETPRANEEFERIVFVNRAFERVTGFAADEAIGATPRLLHGPLTDADTLAAMHARLSRHVAVREELINYRKNGEAFRLEIDIVPVFDHNGSNSHYVAVARDVSQRHQTSEQLEENRQKYRAMFELSQDSIYLVDARGYITSANPRAVELSGYTESELLDTPLSQLVAVNDHEQVFRLLGRSLRGGQDTVTVTGIRADGERRTITISASAMVVKGKIRGALGIVSDVTEQHRERQQLQIATDALNQVSQAAVITDSHWRVLWINKAFTDITGFSAGDAAGRMLTQLADNPDTQGFFQRIEARLRDGGHWQGEITHARKDGDTFPAWLSLSTFNGEHARPDHFICLFSDMSRHKHYEQRLEFLAHKDALTGLPNRTLLEKQAGDALARARRHRRIMGLIYIDLDQFKAINDSLGHAAGDSVLLQVAERFSNAIRATDTIARPGADEFIVLLEELRDSSDAALVADNLLRELNRPLRDSGHELFTSASLGISCYPEDGEDVQTLLRNADAAMYRAKELGRNTYAFYSTEINARAKDYLFIANSLRQALPRGELHLHYQPSVDLRSGRILGAEALARWHHPERGPIAPDQFIPVAEATGLIGTLGDWALRTACREAQAWEELGYGSIPVAVNLSARQLSRPELAATVKQALEETGLAPWRLKLEITESMVMEQPEQASRLLHALHALGVGIAIDDFGTGYSSLSALKQFPFDCLKIDRSFVSGLPGDGDDASITRTILSMARAMQLSVVAEGVETDAQRRFLQTQGCPEGQGFLFSRALPPSEFRALLAQAGERAAFAPLIRRRPRRHPTTASVM